MGDGPAGHAETGRALVAARAGAAGLRIAILALAVLLAGQAPAAATDRDEIRRIVVEEALRSDRVPPSLALAVAEAESDFDPDAESPAGARGVMQIMPATGRGEFGVAPDALWRPRLNARLGIAFLGRLIERYGERWDLALSHYNGGSRVGRGAAARVIPATRGYVDKVLELERRNAADASVRLLVAEAGGTPAGPMAGSGWPQRGAPTRLAATGPATAAVVRSVGGFAAAPAGTVDWRPSARPRRSSEPPSSRQDRMAPPEDRPGAPSGSGALLAGIEAARLRFRALLAAVRDG